MQQTFVALVASFVAVQDAQADYVGKAHVFANQMAQVFVPKMEYSAFVASRDAWKAEYRKAKGATDGATDQAFSEALSKMNDHLSRTGKDTFSPPKSDGVDAVKKGAQREKAKEKRSKALEECGVKEGMTSAQIVQALSKAKRASAEAKAVALAFQRDMEVKEARAEAKAEEDEKKSLADAIRDYYRSAPIAKAREEAKRLALKLSTK